MKSINTIVVYEEDGKKTGIGETKEMVVENHLNYKDLVVLHFGEKKLTVSRSELERAMQNASNAHCY